ncbi:TPA: hypothetical protein ACH3X2_000136 [Trebouxia sp. C0005]
MAKSGLPTAKAKGRSQYKATAAPLQPSAPATQLADNSSRKRYEVPADFQENEAALRLQTDPSDTNTELWLFQLPHELDPTESLSWQLSTAPDGAVVGTCHDSEGMSYTLTEEPSDMATKLYTTPAAGSNTLSQFKRRVTVVRVNQLPDTIAAAEAVEAVIPSADMPGIPSTTQPHHDDADEAAPPVQEVAHTTVQKQQQQQEHQAGQDTLATPDDSKQKRKKAKSEAKKLKKRAQEHTAINEKQSKLQRQSDVPVLAPEALQVSAAAEVKSEAAQLQDNIEAIAIPAAAAAAAAALHPTADTLKQPKEKKDSKENKKKKKKKKHKDRRDSQTTLKSS